MAAASSIRDREARRRWGSGRAAGARSKGFFPDKSSAPSDRDGHTENMPLPDERMRGWLAIGWRCCSLMHAAAGSVVSSAQHLGSLSWRDSLARCGDLADGDLSRRERFGPASQRRHVEMARRGAVGLFKEGTARGSRVGKLQAITKRPRRGVRRQGEGEKRLRRRRADSFEIQRLRRVVDSV